MNSRSFQLASALAADIGTRYFGSVPPELTSAKEFAKYSLARSLLKKYCPDDDPPLASCEAAARKFLAINQHCADWSLRIETPLDDALTSQFRDVVRRFWEPDGALVQDYRQLFILGGLGSGRNLGCHGEDFYTKLFDSPLSGSSELHFMWSRHVSSDPKWAEASAYCQRVHGVRVTRENRQFFVKKTTTIARTASTEPTINMWYQKGLGSLLEERIKTFFGFDLASQPDRNRDLAYSGSLDGSFDTTDLESASDCLSMRMLEEFLPSSFMAVLKLLRCDEVRLTTGEKAKLEMVSTMGNGFTFPLQTVIFSCVVKAVYELLGSPMWRVDRTLLVNDPQRRRMEFGVFGDDIITRHHATRWTHQLLKLLGFIVNTDKSFDTGPFRESCGADYFLGSNVRGVYVKDSLDEQSTLYAAVNNLNRWSAKTEVPLDLTISLLISWLRRPLVVPFTEGDTAGIHGSIADKGYVALRCYEAYVPRVWQFIIESNPEGELVGFRTFGRQVRRNWNPSGVLIGYLQGGIRGGRITLRQRTVRYTTKWFGTLNWDAVPSQPHYHFSDVEWSRRLVDACARAVVTAGFGA